MDNLQWGIISTELFLQLTHLPHCRWDYKNEGDANWECVRCKYQSHCFPWDRSVRLKMIAHSFELAYLEVIRMPEDIVSFKLDRMIQNN